MTSIEERKIVSDYVLKRELPHPKTNIINAAYFLSLLLLVCFAISMVMKIFFEKIPFMLIFMLAFFLVSFILLKKIIIGLVELYQHYMPEELRRRCLCMPTCSEYMILAVEKYGALKGLRKGMYRLMHTCRGKEYKIDYP